MIRKEEWDEYVWIILKDENLYCGQIEKVEKEKDIFFFTIISKSMTIKAEYKYFTPFMRKDDLWDKIKLYWE